VLIPDFQGNRDSLATVLAASPDVMNHNIETVPRLFPSHRLGGDYALSLELLRRSREIAPGIPTKSGLMLGMGETDDEIIEVMRDLVATGVEILTLGQYLQPTRKHAPVDRYLPPETFLELARRGRSMGFRHVESGPLVRSSYHAESHIRIAETR
jgi:lipoic acid synthetase